MPVYLHIHYITQATNHHSLLVNTKRHFKNYFNSQWPIKLRTSSYNTNQRGIWVKYEAADQTMWLTAFIGTVFRTSRFSTFSASYVPFHFLHKRHFLRSRAVLVQTTPLQWPVISQHGCMRKDVAIQEEHSRFFYPYFHPVIGPLLSLSPNR